MKPIAFSDPTVCGTFRAGVRVGTLTLALAMMLAATAVAATYYVDNQSPTGFPTGPGTKVNPYTTISAAVAAHKGPGVTIIVNPGVYREQVTIPASGASGNRYVIRAAGPGVVIDGADRFSELGLWVRRTPVPAAGSLGLASVVDDVWLASSVTWDVQQVFVDGVRLTRLTTSPAVLTANTFTWVAGEGLYVNLGGNNPATRQTLVGRRSNGFDLFLKSWVTVDGFEVTRSESRGINLQNGCTDMVISNNRVSLAGDFGIHTLNGLHILIDSNVVSDCNYHGIGLTAGASGCVLRNNESFRNVIPQMGRATGIYLFQAPENILVGNNCHDNQDTGIQLSSGSNNCIEYNNRSWNNGDHGYDHLSTSGTIHVNDVAYRNVMDGFSIEGDSPNSQMFNCISVENGLTTDEFNLWVNGLSAVGFVSDHNIFWNSTSQPPIKYITTKYATVAAFQAVSGQDAHSIQANPQFVSSPSGNFLPMRGSPAIDAGTSAVANWPATDALGNARVDDYFTPNRGTGPVSYSDIGALEFVDGAEFAPVVLPNPLVTMGDRGAGRASVASPAASEGTPASAFALSSGFPNPSRGAVDFALDLPADARVTFEVFDLQGRVVWSEQRALAAGRSRVTWDGRSASGEPAGTGVYLVRAQMDEKRFTRRVVRF